MDDIQLARIKRLKQFQNALNIKQIELARLLQTNPGFISQMMNGKRKISEAFAYDIGRRYSWFNPDWLITGNGSMKIIEDENFKVGILNDPMAVYEKSAEPFDMLRLWKESFEDRIKKLEAEVIRLNRRISDIEGDGNSE